MTTYALLIYRMAPAAEPIPELDDQQALSRHRDEAVSNMKSSAENLFWQLAAELQQQDPRVREGTIMNGRCLRVGQEFLALVDYRGSGLIVKLPKTRVTELIEAGVGKPFGPAGKIFAEWLSVPKPDRRRWRDLLREGIEFVGR
jgi:hypothetical protein